MVSISDKFGRASDGTGYVHITTVKTARVAATMTLECYDLSKASTTTPVFFMTYKKVVDPVTEEVTISNQTSWKALVNIATNSFTNMEVAPGYTDIGNEVGDFVELMPTSYWGDELASGIMQQHKADGTHNAVTATSLSTTGNISAGGTLSSTGATSVGGALTVTGDVAVTGSVRATPRLSATTSTTSLTPNIDNYNVYDVTALAAGLAVNAPTGTPRNGDILIFRIKDNGTTRAITWNAAFQNVSGLPNITNTTVSKWHTVGTMYSTAASKWLIVSVTTEA